MTLEFVVICFSDFDRLIAWKEVFSLFCRFRRGSSWVCILEDCWWFCSSMYCILIVWSFSWLRRDLMASFFDLLLKYSSKIFSYFVFCFTSSTLLEMCELATRDLASLLGFGWLNMLSLRICLSLEPSLCWLLFCRYSLRSLGLKVASLMSCSLDRVWGRSNSFSMRVRAWWSNSFWQTGVIDCSHYSSVLLEISVTAHLLMLWLFLE